MSKFNHDQMLVNWSINQSPATVVVNTWLSDANFHRLQQPSGRQRCLSTTDPSFDKWCERQVHGGRHHLSVLLVMCTPSSECVHGLWVLIMFDKATSHSHVNLSRVQSTKNTTKHTADYSLLPVLAIPKTSITTLPWSTRINVFLILFITWTNNRSIYEIVR